ncbi:MAG TPA: EamA family transporter, partial [Alphaproteobacteria bacterium]|nr:EamA family transporter [Alphaproteobacteria bacterium]
RDSKLVLLRVISEVAATVGFLTALAHMPLANVTAILQALPLTVTMAAALFLGEPVGWRRWLA